MSSSSIPTPPAAASVSGPPLTLTGRQPHVPADRLVTEMVPPPKFAQARFDTYLPDPDQPSQAEAVQMLREFAGRVGGSSASGAGRRRWFRRDRATPAGPAGVYLDGGYGVGKTHLLAALWHAVDAPRQQKAFGTFVELTNLVGALGFQQAVRELSGHQLLCIDEFELDDPGDTVLVSSLLRRLVDAGVKLAATSNTLPDKLGEGRFAADDFLREIQGLAAHFRTLRIEGEDYRHRGMPRAPEPAPLGTVEQVAAGTGQATLDDFPALLEHLPRVHPSRYGALLDGVSVVCLRDVHPVTDQATALRMVVLADRLYDRELPVLASGIRLDELFTPEMLEGGYRKKYLRAVSRLASLARDGARLAA